MGKIPVLLVDDHAVVREGLRLLVETQNDMRVLGEAENGRQAVLMADRVRGAVIVMDMAMPLLNGVEATRQILKAQPRAKVLVLSSYSDSEGVAQMMRAGAAGFLVKQTAANELLKAIREVHRGNAYFSPNVAKRLRDLCRQDSIAGPPDQATAELTSRESEVLQLIAEGHLNKQIAAELGISIKTVEKHRQQVMNKLNIHETAGLTRYALSKGVVENTGPAAGMHEINQQAIEKRGHSHQDQ